jgi:hypothetical protein
MAPIPETLIRTSSNFVGPRALDPSSSESPSEKTDNSAIVDSFTPSSANPLGCDWNDLVKANQLRQMANSRSGGRITFGGPGDFSDPRANLAEIRKMADNAVDKHGPLSAKALFLRGAEVFYQMSPAPAAQEAGEAWGGPSSSKSQKAWASANLGLHLLEIAPAAGMITNSARGVRATSVGSRSSHAGGNLGMVGRVRARQSTAGFAKIPSKTQTASAASNAVRQTNNGVTQVENMTQFFESTNLGKALSGQSQKTGRVFQGAPVYKMTEKVKIGETALKKGDHFYLDNLHKDHLEVFNKQGKLVDVLNFNGERLVKKLRNAQKQERNIKNLVSDGSGMSKNHNLA